MSLLSPPLVAFVAVAENKTVHAAADALFLTQTAVTQRIRVLERSLKSTLFVRTRRGMMLTPEGEALLRYCQASKVLEGQAIASITGGGIDAEVELCITAASSLMRARVIPRCIAVMRCYPQLLMRYHVNDSVQRALSLRQGESDFVVTTRDQVTAEMSSQPMCSEEYVLVASSLWRGRRLKEIVSQERIIDFDESDQVTLNYLKQYQLYELANSRRHFVNQTEQIAYMVVNGLGYSSLPKEFAQPYLDRGELIMLNRARTHCVEPVLAWFDQPQPPAYFSAIIDALR